MARLTLKDFEIKMKLHNGEPYCEYIDHLTLKHVMGNAMYERYCDWSRGQTCIGEGDFPCDVEAFLEGQTPLD